MQLPFGEKFIFTIKALLAFIVLIISFSIAYIGRELFVPMVYATIIAVAINPIVNFFVQRKVNRLIAITITLTLVTLIVSLIIIFISIQMVQFSDSIPKLIDAFHKLSDQVTTWISHHFNISNRKINLWITEKNTEMLDGTESAIGQTLIHTGNAVFIIILIPVYTFMILLYKSHLLEFINKLFEADHTKKVGEVIMATKKIIQKYLIGLLFEAFIVALLNTASLLIIGIDYAILLGVIGAILNIIPYIGGIIAVALPMLIAVTTTSPVSALFVLVAYILIQFIDNNYIIPKIVASKVEINPLISIIVVLIGGAIWGISGMFLAIPLTAIIKVIFDCIEPLKPWGFLLGNIVPTNQKLFFHKQNQKNM